MGSGDQNGESLSPHFAQRDAPEFNFDSLELQCSYPTDTTSIASSSGGRSNRQEAEARKGRAFRTSCLDSGCENVELYEVRSWLWLEEAEASLSVVRSMCLLSLFGPGKSTLKHFTRVCTNLVHRHSIFLTHQQNRRTSQLVPAIHAMRLSSHSSDTISPQHRVLNMRYPPPSLKQAI